MIPAIDVAEEQLGILRCLRKLDDDAVVVYGCGAEAMRNFDHLLEHLGMHPQHARMHAPPHILRRDNDVSVVEIQSPALRFWRPGPGATVRTV